MKKTKKKRQENYRSTAADAILSSPLATFIAGLVAIALGLLFVFVVGAYTPISRQDAVSYSGQFEDYDYWDDSYTIKFQDGATYDVTYWMGNDFDNYIEDLKKGDKLRLLINPYGDYVLEIKKGGNELIKFEETQQVIKNDSLGFRILGAVIAAGGVFLIFFAAALRKNNDAEKEKRRKKHKGAKLNESAPKKADLSKRARILLEAETPEFKICYRRVRSTNELIVNGYVYDTKKAVIEFEHALFANVGGHKIEAGLDEQSYSYIKLDGEILEEKERIV